MKSTLVRAALLLVPMFVAACGGGGGGGDSGGSTATPVAITTSNAPAVAAEALEVATNTDAAQQGSSLMTGVQISGSGGTGTVGPMRLAAVARKLAAKAQGSSTLATGVAVPQPCSLGGTIAVDGYSSGSGIPTAGDWVQEIASNCTESDGTTNVVTNGSLKVSIVAGSYDPDSVIYPKSVTMRIEATNFSVTSGGVSEVFNGDLTMALTETSATTGSVALTATSLSNKIGSHTVTLSNYSLNVSEDASGSTMEINATVRTSNSRLGGHAVSYSIATLTPVAVTSAGVVTAGKIKVTGANSALLLTVTGDNSFSLQVDANGDGTYEWTITITRTELQAQV